MENELLNVTADKVKDGLVWNNLGPGFIAVSPQVVAEFETESKEGGFYPWQGKRIAFDFQLDCFIFEFVEWGTDVRPDVF